MEAGHADENDAEPSAHLALGSDAIRLADIDRLLEESVRQQRPGSPPAIRAWRDDLALALAALQCAGHILSADAAILRHCLAARHPGSEALIAELPHTLAAPSNDRPPSLAPLTEGPEDADSQILSRSLCLMSTHQEMARTDLSSPLSVRQTLAALERQSDALARRQSIVAARLQEIRAAVISEYTQRATPSLDTPA